MMYVTATCLHWQIDDWTMAGYSLITFLEANLMSSGLIVFLPACKDRSTACLAILSATSSRTFLNSSAASSLTRSAPDFFMIRYIAARPNSGPEDIGNTRHNYIKSVIVLLLINPCQCCW